MFRRFGDSFRRFMYGRYGSDGLNVALLLLAIIVSVVNTVLSIFLRNSIVFCNIVYPLLHLLTLTLLGLNIFRSFSRNIFRRQQENRAFRRLRARLTDRKNRYYHCPKCKQTVRVPRGKGKISIRCPKCGEKFIRKT